MNKKLKKVIIVLLVVVFIVGLICVFIKIKEIENKKAEIKRIERIETARQEMIDTIKMECQKDANYKDKIANQVYKLYIKIGKLEKTDPISAVYERIIGGGIIGRGVDSVDILGNEFILRKTKYFGNPISFSIIKVYLDFQELNDLDLNKCFCRSGWYEEGSAELCTNSGHCEVPPGSITVEGYLKLIDQYCVSK